VCLLWKDLSNEPPIRPLGQFSTPSYPRVSGGRGWSASMSQGSFFELSKYVFYRFLIFLFLQKLFRGFHTFDKFCTSKQSIKTNYLKTNNLFPINKIAVNNRLFILWTMNRRWFIRENTFNITWTLATHSSLCNTPWVEIITFTLYFRNCAYVHLKILLGLIFHLIVLFAIKKIWNSRSKKWAKAIFFCTLLLFFI